MSETASSPRRYLPARFTHWLAELLLVFLGAYAAFWLSNYQQHREEIRRHDQLLAALEDEVIAGIENAKANSQRQDKTVAEFRRAYEAGEMPALHPVNFTGEETLRSEKAFDGDVFVYVVPMNADPAADEPPVRALGGRSAKQARRPGQWRGDATTVHQCDDEFVVGANRVGGIFDWLTD